MMGNLTEAVGLFDSEPHTDLTDPTGFLCGWKISRRLVGLFDSEPHTDLTNPTGFLCGWEISRRLVGSFVRGNLTDFCE